MNKLVSAAHQQLSDLLLEDIEHGRYRMGQRMPTAREIAKKYSVGLGTVQQAFHQLTNQGYISCKVGKGTFVAQEPKRRWLKPVAVWPGNPLDDQIGCSYRNAIIGAIHDGLAPTGASIRPIQFDSAVQRIEHFEGMIQDLAGEISGLICFPIHADHPIEDFLKTLSIPWVLINQPTHQTIYNFVSTDFYAGTLSIGRHLASIGVRRLWVFEGQLRTGYHSARLRLRGLQDGFLQEGVLSTDSRIEDLDVADEECGYRTTQRLLRSGPPPDAIVAAGDVLAFGAMRAVLEAGLRIPEDVNIVGLTGTEAAKHSEPSLSVLQLPMNEIGKSAAKLLIEQIKTGSRFLPGIMLPAEFLIRESVRKIGNPIPRAV